MISDESFLVLLQILFNSWYECVTQGASEQDVTRSVIVTIRAMKEHWSVPHQRVHQADTFVDVMNITQATTVNSPSIKLVLPHGGVHQSVDLATVQRIVVLIQVVTSTQDSAVAG